MKNFLILISTVIVLTACSTKKTETTSTTDSLSLTAEMADAPAPASLAFSPMAGFTAKNTVAMDDTVNFILLTSQEDIDKNFAFEKSATEQLVQPEFIINFMVAMVCLPTEYETTLGVEKVEVGTDAINVYMTMTRGEKHSMPTKPTLLFAIERRDGFSKMQFFVNGKPSKALMLI